MCHTYMVDVLLFCALQAEWLPSVPHSTLATHDLVDVSAHSVFDSPSLRYSVVTRCYTLWENIPLWYKPVLCYKPNVKCLVIFADSTILPHMSCQDTDNNGSAISMDSSMDTCCTISLLVKPRDLAAPRGRMGTLQSEEILPSTLF